MTSSIPPLEFREGWPLLAGVPITYLNGLRDSKNEESRYAPDKLPYPAGKRSFDSFVLENGGRAPTTLAHSEAGEIIDRGGTRYGIAEFLRTLPHGSYFCKPDVSERGAGAFRLDVTRAGITGGEVHSTLASIVNALAARPYLVQQSLVPLQHAAISCFNPQIINSVRLITFDHETGPAAAGAMLRLANTSDSVDNLSAGGVGVPIDLESGRLQELGRVKLHLAPQPLHTRSGLSFRDRPVPHFDKAVALACRLHNRLPAKTLGWDIAMLADGPCVIEANRNWALFSACGMIPGMFARFLRYHLPEDAELAVRVRLSGDFWDPHRVRLWTSYLVGRARASGRLDSVSAETAVLIVAGSKSTIDSVVQRLQAAGSAFRASKVAVQRVPNDVHAGFDMRASFSAPRDEAAAAM